MNRIRVSAPNTSAAEFDAFRDSMVSGDWAAATGVMTGSRGGACSLDFVERIIDSGLATAVSHRWAPIKNRTGGGVTPAELANIDSFESGPSLLAILCDMACVRGGSAPIDINSPGVVDRMVASVAKYARPLP